MPLDYAEPQPTGLSPRAIIDLAERFAEDFQDPATRRVDVKAMLQHLKGKIIEKDVWTEGVREQEAILVHGPGDFEVHLPDTSLEQFRNFSIAHELGHYILHYLWNRKAGKQVDRLKAHMNRRSEPTEHEANLFASALLMPTADVQEIIENGQHPLLQYPISEKFSVPLKTAETWLDAVRNRKY